VDASVDVDQAIPEPSGLTNAGLAHVLRELRRDAEQATQSVSEITSRASTTVERDVLACGEAVRRILDESNAYDSDFTSLAAQFKEAAEGDPTLAAAVGSLTRLMADVPRTFERIGHRMQDIAARTAEVEAKVAVVLRAVDELNNIALTSRMLAINAQIEAARAGDAGHGFAEVARTIQELSRRASEQNNEIGDQGAQVRVLLPAVAKAVDEVMRQCGAETQRIEVSTGQLALQYDQATAQVLRGVNASRSRGATFRALSSEILERIQFGDRIAQDLRSAVEETRRPAKVLDDLVQCVLEEGTPPEELQRAIEQARSVWSTQQRRSRARGFSPDMLSSLDHEEEPVGKAGALMFL
jgi:methyl-accepting chemotaxis protein